MTGTTKHFAIRSNVLTTTSTSLPAILLKDNTGLAEASGNTVNHRATGLSVTGGATIATGNTIRDTSSPAFFSAGVATKGSVVLVANSTFIANDVAVHLTDSRANVTGNLVVSGLDGVNVKGGDAVLRANEIQVSQRAVYAEAAAKATVVGGLLTRPGQGLVSKQSDLVATGVRIEAATQFAAVLDQSKSVLSSLQVVGGANGVLAVGGRLDVSGSGFTGVLATALAFRDGTGSATSNAFVQNGGGASIDGASVVSLVDNSFVSNGWGVGIGYAARASIPHLSGNFVNGAPLAGAYHWRVANVYVTGAFDNGYSLGYYGSRTREGAFVFYEVEGARVESATISHNLFGVHAVSSFDVVVIDSFLVMNRVGVHFNDTVGSVKDTDIDIPIDPPQTIGVWIRGGVGVVLSSTIRNVDLGILVDGGARANLSSNSIELSRTGIELVGGAQYDVNVFANDVRGGHVGIQTRSKFQGEIRANNLTENARAGVRVEGGASFSLVGNRVDRNGRGFEDATPCASSDATSARPRFERNTVSNNTLFGVTVNGSLTSRGNVVADNGDDGAMVCGHVDGRFDTFARNGRDGLEIRGSANLAVDSFHGQRFGAGLRLMGTLFVVSEANVTANLDGIVVNEPLPGLPALPSAPTVPTLPTIPCPTCVVNPDPLWIHLSKIHKNVRFAIQATPQTDVNATHNWWGSTQPPSLWIPQYGEYGNVVSPNVRFVPWYRDEAMTIRGPL